MFLKPPSPSADFQINILDFLLSPTVRSSDKRIACDEEFSDSEDEGEGGRKNVANFKKAKRPKTEDEEKEEEKKGRVEPRT